jgi:hypothetical protein
MAKKLSDSEIKQRLRQLRNVTHLHAVAREKLAQALATIKALKQQLVNKELRIAELETRLLDKEGYHQDPSVNVPYRTFALSCLTYGV